ncbi:MAG TPA: tRNA 2-selenouridine(34) synthase MnmH, partial [Saprospiraceae bacterium]|nr:tRNA 2-selenouridine(34) synthase MnmH [Saprospiraceae bacterium]
LSFPLCDDAERAAVGTAYKQRSREAALELGLEIVGPKMAHFVRQAKHLAPQRRLALHCWRGGQRSGSMAWLLRQAGFDVLTLDGGYKQYRRWVLERFAQPVPSLLVLGGRTGSGKTKVLQQLAALGEQVLDLERLAHHKGSSFGSIGETPQPTVEQFENELCAALGGFDTGRRIWLENESRHVGRVYLPDAFWAQMKSAPLVNIEVPQDTRIRHLLADYVLSDREALREAFLRIEKKLGGQHLKAALAALDADDFATAASIALHYYDKTYQYGLDTSPSPHIWRLSFRDGSPAHIAQALHGRDFSGTPPMRRLAIFASGGGSNARRILEHFQHHAREQVALVVCNKPDAGVLSIAREHGVPTHLISRQSFYHTEELLEVLKEHAVDFVALAGFLWLMPPYLVEAFERRMVNIHPALLPKFGGQGMYGAHVHAAVQAAGETQSGMTVHYVNTRYDEGDIVFQASCAVLPEDSPDDIAHRVLKLEHEHYPAVLERLLLTEEL